MSKKDTISVIIPMYNVEDYLEECLDSVVNQDYGLDNIEVIMIDDGSSDKTLTIAKKYQKKYNFKLLKNEKNSGQAISRNRAIKEATGKYIAFLDSDDMLYKNNLTALYEEITKNKADLVIARLNSFDSKGEYGYYSNKYISDYRVTNIFESNDLVDCISVCSKLYKADLVKKVEFLPNTFHEDNSFTLSCLFKAKKIVIYPENLYFRRIREGENKSTMQKLDYKTFTDLILNYKISLKNIKTNKNIYFLYKWMIRKLNNYLVTRIKKDQIKNGKEDIKDFIIELNIADQIKRKLKIYNYFYYFIARTYSFIKK